MSRLFTFGCSYTKYIWPTWADFVGLSFNEHQNWGRSGAGNYYILSKLIECNDLEKITKDDVVLIMFSSTNRFDVILPNSSYTTIGNIYCETGFKIFGEHFVQNVWSIEHGVYNSWVCVNAIKTILDGIGCKYKLMTAFDFYSIDHYLPPTYVEPVTTRLKNCLDDLETIFNKRDLNTFIKNNYMIDTMYKFDSITDYHPTITMHHDWVKEILSEYYNENMITICKDWESKISTNRSEVTQSFATNEMKGIETKQKKTKLI